VILSLGLLLLLPVRAGASESPDVAAARALFQRNLAAVANRDKAGYLACYLNEPTLARTGPEGFELGYASLEKAGSEPWPDTFEALDLHLVPVRDGVVYGTYRYRVRYGAEEHSGLSERTFVKTPAGWRIAVSTAFDGLVGTPPPARALVGATLVDGTGAPPLANAVVVVTEGRIACVGSRVACPVPAGVDVADLEGRWLTPGLIDAHVHLSQTGWADGRPDAFDVREAFPYEAVQADLQAHPERFFRSYLCSGVTSIFDVGGYPWTVTAARAHASDLAAPRLSAAGPLLSTFEPGRLDLPAAKQFIVMKDEATTRAAVRYVQSLGASAVKVWYIVGPGRTVEQSEPAVLAAGDEARKLGIPLIVHATGLAEARVALRAGARLLVHSVDDQPVDQEFLDLARRAGTIYTPTLTVIGGYLRMFEAAAAQRRPAIGDPNSCVDNATMQHVAMSADGPWGGDPLREAGSLGAEDARARGVEAANLKRIFDAEIPIAMGTDAGNPLTLHGPSVYAEMEAMAAAGLTPLQVLVASTHGGSLALGRDAEVGTVEKGKIADLLVLSADPTASIGNMRRVEQVMRGGVLRSITELRAAVAAGGAQQ
jgi:imidazolonepropionase-like amidohydrolase